jgi:hypothetical protein
MKSLALILLLAMGTGHPAEKKYLNGTWSPIRLEIGGNNLPGQSFVNQRLTIQDSVYTFVAESVDKGVVFMHDNKMDIYGRDGVNKGKHFTAIFKYEKAKRKDGLSRRQRGSEKGSVGELVSGGMPETLTICYNLKGDGYPKDLTTKGKPMYFLAVFVRTKG